MRIAFRGTRPIRVESSGQRIAAGELSLRQTIWEGQKPARTREWRLRSVGPGRYAGTLTDADGPVTGVSEGNRLTLNFPLNGMQVTQTLTLAPDTRSARNILTVRKFGMQVAVLDETIRKID